MRHGLTAEWKGHNIMLTDPSTPLNDAHHGRTFLLDIKHMGENKLVTTEEQRPITQVKPAKSLKEQLQILKKRGLAVEDDAEALRILERSNYYRLRGYYIHLQKTDSDEFLPGVSFTQISELHDFDNELRALLLGLLLDVEIVARARIAYTMAQAWGAMGYRNIANYGKGCDAERFAELMDKIDQDLGKSRERFIKTYNEKYEGQFPVWVAVEVISFGELSKMYYLLPIEMKKTVAAAYDGLDEALLTNWIQCSAMLRNICAHNSRLYARSIPTPIKVEKVQEMRLSAITGAGFKIRNQSLFSYLLALRRISVDKTWNSFLTEFDALLKKYDCYVEPIRLGLPYQWKQLLQNK